MNAAGTPHATRVVVVANDEIGASDVPGLMEIAGTAGHMQTMVVAPALNRFLGRAVVDPAAAEGDAARRAVHAVLELSAAGIHSIGIVGDADPLFAIDDALAVFDADVVVIAVAPRHAEGWLGQKLAERARVRFALPVRLAVVDRHDQPRPIAA